MKVLVDFSNVCIITYSAFIGMQQKKFGKDYVIDEEGNDLRLFYHMMFNKIMPYFTNYKDVIFCGEGINSTKWRKETYKCGDYKGNREQRKENPNYKYIGEIFNETRKLLRMFHCRVLNIPNCEADDTIYKLSEYFSEKGEEVMIVSTDKDLVQILNYFDGVSLYNPIKKCYVEKDPNIVLYKCIVGDSSDSIFGQKKAGQKFYEKVLEDKNVLLERLAKDNNQDIFDMTLKIVDLRRYPKEFHEKVIDEYENQKWHEFDKEGIEKWLFDHQLKQLLGQWGEICMKIEMNLSGGNITSAEKELEDLLNE